MLTVQAYLARLEKRLPPPDENGCIIWPGATDHDGYGTIQTKVWSGRAVHRFIYSQTVRPVEREELVDHICGVRRCVNPQHLRAVTPQQNTEHRVQIQQNNTSGYPGVSWRPDRQQWHASGRRNGRPVWLGGYDDPYDAYQAYVRFAREHYPFADERLLTLPRADQRQPRDVLRTAA